MTLKKSFMALSLLLCSCKSAEIGPNIKVYSSQPDQGAMVRTQAQEFVPYAQTKDWLCSTPPDYEALLNWCKNPKADPSISNYIHMRMEMLQPNDRITTSNY